MHAEIKADPTRAAEEAEIEELANEVRSRNNTRANQPASQSTAVQSATAQDSAGIDSNAGPFGWTTVLKDVALPFIKRNDDEYVAAEMVAKAVIPTVKLNFISDEGMKCWKLGQDVIDENEAISFNEINQKHCDGQFGKHVYKKGDIVFKLDDLKRFLYFINICGEIVRGTKKSNTVCGFIQIDCENVVPFVWDDSKQLVPVFYFDDNTNYLQNKAKDLTDIEKLSYLQFCCKVQKIRSSYYEKESISVVDLEEIKQLFPKNTKFETHFPNDVNDDLLPLNSKVLRTVNSVESAAQRETTSRTTQPRTFIAPDSTLVQTPSNVSRMGPIRNYSRQYARYEPSSSSSARSSSSSSSSSSCSPIGSNTPPFAPPIIASTTSPYNATPRYIPISSSHQSISTLALPTTATTTSQYKATPKYIPSYVLQSSLGGPNIISVAAPSAVSTLSQYRATPRYIPSNGLNQVLLSHSTSTGSILPPNAVSTASQNTSTSTHPQIPQYQAQNSYTNVGVLPQRQNVAPGGLSMPPNYFTSPYNSHQITSPTLQHQTENSPQTVSLNSSSIVPPFTVPSTSSQISSIPQYQTSNSNPNVTQSRNGPSTPQTQGLTQSFPFTSQNNASSQLPNVSCTPQTYGSTRSYSTTPSTSQSNTASATTSTLQAPTNYPLQPPVVSHPPSSSNQKFKRGQPQQKNPAKKTKQNTAVPDQGTILSQILLNSQPTNGSLNGYHQGLSHTVQYNTNNQGIQSNHHAQENYYQMGTPLNANNNNSILNYDELMTACIQQQLDTNRNRPANINTNDDSIRKIYTVETCYTANNNELRWLKSSRKYFKSYIPLNEINNYFKDYHIDLVYNAVKHLGLEYNTVDKALNDFWRKETRQNSIGYCVEFTDDKHLGEILRNLRRIIMSSA